MTGRKAATALAHALGSRQGSAIQRAELRERAKFVRLVCGVESAASYISAPTNLLASASRSSLIMQSCTPSTARRHLLDAVTGTLITEVRAVCMRAHACSGSEQASEGSRNSRGAARTGGSEEGRETGEAGRREERMLAKCGEAREARARRACARRPPFGGAPLTRSGPPHPPARRPRPRCPQSRGSGWRGAPAGQGGG